MDYSWRNWPENSKQNSLDWELEAHFRFHVTGAQDVPKETHILRISYKPYSVPFILLSAPEKTKYYSFHSKNGIGSKHTHTVKYELFLFRSSPKIVPKV